mmetsp:Transcript_121369/g.354772  ORF Transcript_121369/g.354772 Transcript_121369/m.354772 type:complete len:226 (+) Transcript_121369:1321-1998(+)
MHDVLVGMARHVLDLRHAGVLRDVDRHLLRVGPRLQEALLGVLASAPEELRRLQPERTKPFSNPVDEGMGVPCSFLIILLLESLLLLLRPVQPLLPLLLAPDADVVEVALAEVLDGRVRGQDALEDLPEVLNEDLLRLVVAAPDRRPVRGNLLCLGRELDGLALVLDGDTMGFVLGTVHQAVVLEGVPLLGASFAAKSSILPLPPPVHGLVVCLCFHEHLGRAAD